MTKRRYDPHTDPMRAPSAAGQHPHTHRLRDEVKNPQNMYEQRDGLSPTYKPMAHDPRSLQQQPPPQRKPGLLDVLAENPLAMLAAGAGFAWLLSKAFSDNDGERSVRQNPDYDVPQPQPQTTTVVVPQPVPQLIPAPLAAAQAAAQRADRDLGGAEKAIRDVESAIAKAATTPCVPTSAGQVVDAEIVETPEKKKGRRRTQAPWRRTTQKHGPDGKFLSAKTARPYYEGVGKKAPTRRGRSK